MKERMKYLWNRIQAAAIVGEVLLAALTAWAWILSLEYSLRMIPAAFFTVSLILYNWFLYRLVYLPYKESRAVYEQFVKGYVLDDLFKMRYPFSAESAQAVQKFNELLDKENLINASKKQAEYLALQNQINPHFLYNTLEGIRSEALLAGLDGVAEMTEALATFFRYTISQVEHLVTLEDELANIENYYYIQQFRFGDKLALSIVYDHDEDVSELDILNCRLPKLTLQPIVENSIYHGIERKIGRGHLVIRIGVSDTRLRIRVSDDGLGMSEEKLYQLNEKLRSLSLDAVGGREGGEGGIAVVNVNNRIKLLFGEEYGIQVYSHEGTGTDVVIQLPLKTDSEEGFRRGGIYEE